MIVGINFLMTRLLIMIVRLDFFLMAGLKFFIIGLNLKESYKIFARIEFTKVFIGLKFWSLIGLKKNSHIGLVKLFCKSSKNIIYYRLENPINTYLLEI